MNKKYRDIDIDKVTKYGEDYIYNGDMLTKHKQYNGIKNSKLKFFTDRDGGVMVVKKLDLKEDVNEINTINKIRKFDLNDKKYFNNMKMLFNDSVIMDFFTNDLYTFVKKNKKRLDDGTRKFLLDYTTQLMDIFFRKNLCFTDIKPEQILIRESLKTNKYHKFNFNGIEYEIACIDVDIDACSSSYYIRTYILPKTLYIKCKKNLSLSRVHSIYAYLVTIAFFYNFDDSFLLEPYFVDNNTGKKVVIKEIEKLKYTNFNIGLLNILYNIVILQKTYEWSTVINVYKKHENVEDYNSNYVDKNIYNTKFGYKSNSTNYTQKSNYTNKTNYTKNTMYSKNSYPKVQLYRSSIII